MASVLCGSRRTNPNTAARKREPAATQHELPPAPPMLVNQSPHYNISIMRNPMDRPTFHKEKAGPCPSMRWPETLAQNLARLANYISGAPVRNGVGLTAAISRVVEAINFASLCGSRLFVLERLPVAIKSISRSGTSQDLERVGRSAAYLRLRWHRTLHPPEDHDRRASARRHYSFREKHRIPPADSRAIAFGATPGEEQNVFVRRYGGRHGRSPARCGSARPLSR